MQTRSLERYAPLAGVAFLVVIAAAVIVGGSTPDTDAGTAKVAAYWIKHDNQQMISAVLLAYSALLLVWFAASLRSVIAQFEISARLATLAFSGAVITAIGILVGASLNFAAADTAGDVPVTTTQTLSVLASDFWIPLPVGLGIMLAASGLAMLRFGWLARWAGWTSIVIAVLMLSPAAWPAILAGPFWVAIISVVLFRAHSAVAQPTAAAAGPPPVTPQPAL